MVQPLRRKSKKSNKNMPILKIEKLSKYYYAEKVWLGKDHLVPSFMLRSPSAAVFSFIYSASNCHGKHKSPNLNKIVQK